MKIKKGLEKEYADFRDLNTKDGYSEGVITYAEKWSDLMEQQIEAGASVADAANTTKYEADTLNITGYMYGCAVSTLAHFWEYGEELRQWHNRDYGYNGQGVVNPAILTISKGNEDIDSTPKMEM